VLVDAWKQGFQVVYARRLSREGESRFKCATARLFYQILCKMALVEIPSDVGDFRLVDRAVVDAFNAVPERDRFVSGMFAWMGFRQTAIDFHRPARVSGETKYPFARMLRLAINGVLGFSDASLRLALWIGMSVSGLALGYGLYILGLSLTGADLVSGWSSTIVVISFLCGINMLMTGIIGLYIGQVHAEVKRRPLYIVNQAESVDAPRLAGSESVRGVAKGVA
jgi:hypothetical protein